MKKICLLIGCMSLIPMNGSNVYGSSDSGYAGFLWGKASKITDAWNKYARPTLESTGTQGWELGKNALAGSRTALDYAKKSAQTLGKSAWDNNLAGIQTAGKWGYNNAMSLYTYITQSPQYIRTYNKLHHSLQCSLRNIKDYLNINVYWILPGVALVGFHPTLFALGVKAVYDFCKERLATNKELIDFQAMIEIFMKTDEQEISESSSKILETLYKKLTKKIDNTNHNDENYEGNSEQLNLLRKNLDKFNPKSQLNEILDYYQLYFLKERLPEIYEELIKQMEEDMESMEKDLNNINVMEEEDNKRFSIVHEKLEKLKNKHDSLVNS
jgi:hypothetical protein